MGVKVVVGSPETQILQAVEGVERPALEVEAEEQAVGQTPVWSLEESPEEALAVGGLGSPHWTFWVRLSWTLFGWCLQGS